MKRLKIILWFVKNPQHFVVLKDMLVRKFLPNKDKTDSQSDKWCSDRAITNIEAVNFLFPNSRFLSLEEEEGTNFNYAIKQESECNIKMGGGADLDLLYNLIIHSNSKKIFETGVAFGWSSFAILSGLKDKKDAVLISGNLPYWNEENKNFIGKAVPVKLKEKWNLIPLADKKSIPKAMSILKEIDMTHYDSDKSYYGRMWSYPRIWKNLKSGGIFISDDISDNIAFHDFSKQLQLEPIIVKFKNKYIGILIKP